MQMAAMNSKLQNWLSTSNLAAVMMVQCFKFLLTFNLVYICTRRKLRGQHLRASPITNASNRFVQMYSTSVTSGLPEVPSINAKGRLRLSPTRARFHSFSGPVSNKKHCTNFSSKVRNRQSGCDLCADDEKSSHGSIASGMLPPTRTEYFTRHFHPQQETNHPPTHQDHSHPHRRFQCPSSCLHSRPHLQANLRLQFHI